LISYSSISSISSLISRSIKFDLYLQAVALALEGRSHAPQTSALTPWPLGGATVFQRSVNDVVTDDDADDITADVLHGFTLRASGDTSHMPTGKFRAGAQAWSLPCITNKALANDKVEWE
jgi:hypothetical protein